MLFLDIAAKTDRGRVRESNQDVAIAAPHLRIVVVADGMGGHSYGEIASRVAARSLIAAFEQLGGPSELLAETRARLIAAFQAANDTVGRHPSAGQPGGLGTTLVAAAFVGRHVVVANVGDSRCYRLRDGGLSVLTDDHSVAAEAVRSPESYPGSLLQRAERATNVLTRCVDGRAELMIDTMVSSCQAEDVFLLCSDGLWGCVGPDTIVAILVNATDPNDACDRLIGAAWAGGGGDNIAVAVVHVQRTAKRLLPQMDHENLNEEATSLTATRPASARPAPKSTDCSRRP